MGSELDLDDVAAQSPLALRQLAALRAVAVERDSAVETMCSALRLVADLRWALGDDGARMQPDLLEYARQMYRDAERYHSAK